MISPISRTDIPSAASSFTTNTTGVTNTPVVLPPLPTLALTRTSPRLLQPIISFGVEGFRLDGIICFSARRRIEINSAHHFASSVQKLPRRAPVVLIGLREKISGGWRGVFWRRLGVRGGGWRICATVTFCAFVFVGVFRVGWRICANIAGNGGVMHPHH